VGNARNRTRFGPDTVYFSRGPQYSIKSKKIRLNMVASSGFVEIGSSHSRKIIWYYFKNLQHFSNYQSFFNSIKFDLIKLLKSFELPLKFNLKLEATLSRPNVEDWSESRAFKARALFADNDFNNVIDNECSVLHLEQDEYMSRGSSFTLQCIDGILVTIYH